MAEVEAEAGRSGTTVKRIAMVTRSNKGVGYGICKLLAGQEVMVVLTTRDEKKGLEAVEKLKQEGVNTDVVLCCPLDLANPATISALTDFIKAQFGRLDILYLNNEWAKGVLRDVESLTKEKIEEVLNVFLKDFREGELESRGWPAYWSAYIAPKAAMNAYTRFLAERYPRLCINYVNLDFVKIDMTANVGSVSIEEAAKGPSDDGPTGLYFDMTKASTYE